MVILWPHITPLLLKTTYIHPRARALGKMTILSGTQGAVGIRRPNTPLAKTTNKHANKENKQEQDQHNGRHPGHKANSFTGVVPVHRWREGKLHLGRLEF